MAIEKFDFNDLFDVNEIKTSVEKAKENSTDFLEVPAGKYEVKIEKIELAANKDKKPMGKIQFRIAEGEFKNSCLFYNQVLIGTDKNTGQLTAFGLHMFNEFLKTLDSGVEIKFDDFNQYADMLLDIAEKVESLSYDIQYGMKNDFPTFKILEIYED